MDERQAKVHPTRQYGVFILSHGRPDKQLTYTTLRREGYTGPIRIVCDDEDSTVEKYKSNFPGEVLVFNKQKAIDATETFYNQPYRKTVVYARGTLYDFSKELGWTHFIMMDDDYYHIYFKWNHYYPEVGLTRFKGMEAQRLDELFDATFDLLAVTKANTISFAQGGDTLGGSSGKAGTHYFSRKAMNSHFVDVSKPLDFRGFVNEDVNLYAEFPGNRFIFQTNRVSVDPAHTQQYKGGATDLYLAFGTYVKSFMTVICAPSCAKVKYMQNGKAQGRIHHLVKTANACPVVVSGRWKKMDSDESSGMKENQSYKERDSEIEKLELEVHPLPPPSWETDPIDKTCKVNSMRKPKNPDAKKKKGKSPAKESSPEVEKALYQVPFIHKEEPKEEKPVEPQTFDIVVDELDNIDPRSLGKLMIELKSKNIPLRIVHGKYDTDDIVSRLCKGLDVPIWPLRDASGFVMKVNSGKRKLDCCKPGEKPVFTKVS